MTGLEPHPIFSLPTQEQAIALGPEKVELIIRERARRMTLEKENPLLNGYEPAIWHVVDDLLVDGNKVLLVDPNGVDVPKELAGRSEILVCGSNRSSKSEYAAKKCMKVLFETPEGRSWSFADTGPISVARQQPIFWKYLPYHIKRLASATGKFRQGAGAKVTYSRANGFSGETFVLENLAQHWFKNYEQDIENVEGDQLDCVWFDELRNPNLLKTIRYRMGDRSGIVIVTFTSIDDNYRAIVDEYEKGSKTILEVDAELLPVKDNRGMPTGRFEKVPRVKVAGPGSDGNQRANIVYFHITDNPYYGFTSKTKIVNGKVESPVFGKERFYDMFRRDGKQARREVILARAYGILPRTSRTKFPEFGEVHLIDPDRIPVEGTNYHFVDPCDGRNWFMIWVRIDPRGHWYVYREWPSYGHEDKSAYIPGIGDPGPWTLPGGARIGGGKPPEDGAKGPAQDTFGFGLSRIMGEILRCEGHPDKEASPAVSEADTNKPLWKRGAPKNPIAGKIEQIDDEIVGEVIAERWMDSRYGSSPTSTVEGQTTLIEQMRDLGMEFLAASGKDIFEGTDMIHEKLDYDKETDLGKYSVKLTRLNEPLMKISRNCPNVIYALREWTGKDKGQGACKDPIDVLRYAMLANCDYLSEEAYTWKGGGSY